MVSAPSHPLQTTSRVLGGLAVILAVVAASYLLFPDPLSDVFFAGWVLVGVALAAIGGAAAWMKRTPLVWATALLLTGLSIIGMWSIGLLFAPAALCLLGTALLLQASGPRTAVREAIVASPPTVPEAVTKTLAGVAGLAVGAGLVYVGAITQDLFGACARETLACALGGTNWGAVGVTLLGLTAGSLGGWLLWKQVHTAYVLSAAGGE